MGFSFLGFLVSKIFYAFNRELLDIKKCISCFSMAIDLMPMLLEMFARTFMIFSAGVFSRIVNNLGFQHVELCNNVFEIPMFLFFVLGNPVSPGINIIGCGAW